MFSCTLSSTIWNGDPQILGYFLLGGHKFQDIFLLAYLNRKKPDSSLPVGYENTFEISPSSKPKTYEDFSVLVDFPGLRVPLIWIPSYSDRKSSLASTILNETCASSDGASDKIREILAQFTKYALIFIQQFCTKRAQSRLCFRNPPEPLSLVQAP